MRVIDALVVYKEARRDLEAEHLSNISEQDAIELGSTAGALSGLGIDGDEGAQAGALARAQHATTNRGVGDAISSSGPHPGFSHEGSDVDAYLRILGDFLDEMCSG